MAMILDAFMSNFASLLTQMVQDEVGMLLGVPGEIEKLERTVGYIICVLADAEKRQIESQAINRWLMELKDVMYDADDIMDLCQIRAQEHVDHSDFPSSSKKRRGFPDLLSYFRKPVFHHEIGTMIRDLNSRLDGIAKQKADLGLSDSQIFLGPSEPARRVGSIISRKTDPSIFQEDIVGEKIEEDTKMFVNWLTEEQKEARQNVVVAAIVGMGGIGKTTLAKKIFNNPKIQEEFTLKIWACISKKVNEVDLLKCIIREAGGEHGDAQERSELVPLLQRLVHGKTFLLVLDDVWEESRAAWDELLRVPMMGGGPGSRLLVTTRDENVATGMKAVKSHRVKKLSEQDSWSLLIKQVFQNEEDREIQNFKDIGLQLIRKCDGLPLAIKSIGGVLCTKNKSIRSWQAVLNSATWSMKELPADVHHAFYLSFEDLTSPLKQCFIACSLYPEDYILDQPQLIYLWIAEGFLQDNGNMWELGIDYYRELLQRNLLEVYGHNYYQDNCKMHDLLWSFACYLRKDETFMLGEASNSRGNVSKL